MSEAPLYPLSGAYAHTFYRGALGPAWDVAGVKVDPIATKGIQVYLAQTKTPTTLGPLSDPSHGSTVGSLRGVLSCK